MNTENPLEKRQSNAKETTIRLLYAILFSVIYYVALFVVGAIILFQFGFTYLTGQHNEKLLVFSGSLNRYVLQILDFLSFRTDQKPYPFDEWPPSDS